MGVDRDRIVGVWMPLHPGLRLRGEGLFRHLSFVAEGLPRDIKFAIFIPPWLREEFEEELADMPAAAREQFAPRYMRDEFSLLTRLMALLIARRVAAGHPKTVLDAYQRRRGGRKRRSDRFLRFADRHRLFEIFTLAVAALGGLGVLVALLRGDWAQALLLVLLTAGLGWFAIRWAVRSLERASEARRGPSMGTSRVPLALRVALRLERRLGPVFDAIAYMAAERDYHRIARKLGARGEVECWYVVNPVLRSARYLRGPVVSAFADFMFLSCPSGVDGRVLRQLRVDIRRVLKKADRVICLSQHVLDGHLPLIGGGRAVARARVVRVAPVSLRMDAPYVKITDGVATKTPESLTSAANVLKAYLASELSHERTRSSFGLKTARFDRRLVLEYFENLPVEEMKFVFCSTQPRSYKNIPVLVRAVSELSREDFPGLKLIMTGEVNFDEPVGKLLTELGHVLDFPSLSRVPRPVHAALYHLAQVVTHPSFYEGGTGAFPLWEGVSVGTPSVLSRTPPVTEDTDLDAMAEYTFDPYSVDALKRTLRLALNDLSRPLKIQQSIIDRKAIAGDTWRRVGSQYAEVIEEAIAAHRG